MKILFLMLYIIKAPVDHPDFEELFIKNDVRLIGDYTEDELEPYYDKIDSKFFGNKSVSINEGIIIDYVADGGFSHANDGDALVEFSADSVKKRSLKRSISVSGDLSVKADISIKKLATKLGANIKVSASASSETTESVQESFKMDLVVKPHTKVSIKLKGTARLTSGVTKRYIAYIETKKGVFEVIEPITETTYYLEEYI